MKPEQFRKVTFQCLTWAKLNKRRAHFTTGVRKVLTFAVHHIEGALAAPRTLANMRPLAILGDNITTDHLSPSNAILMDSAAGEYLHKMGVPEEDFNSYAPW